MGRYAEWTRRTAFFVGSLILSWILVIWFTYMMQPVAAGLSLVITTLFLLMPIAILAPQERLTKGVFLVGLAFLSNLLYSLTVGPSFTLLEAQNGIFASDTGKTIAATEFFTTGAVGQWLLAALSRTQIDFLTQAQKLFDSLLTFVNLACAGAGGSLIAVEADRRSQVIKIAEHSSSVTATSPARTAAPESSPQIGSLTEKLENQAGVLASLDRQITTVDQRISILVEQQARFGRKIVIAGIIGAGVLGFVLGALVFTNI